LHIVAQRKRFRDAKSLAAVEWRVIKQPEMRRTLLAVGIAVLASMLFTPHEHEWDLARQYDWARTGKFFPVFWVEYRNPILWENLIGQTAFVVVLAAVLVNLRQKRPLTID
jgi:hypothetical protein